MRTIKFRAWNIPNKTMYYDVQNGVLAENEKGQLVLGVSLGTLCKDEGSIVMQFTGLHDINGKEIYEGDIVRWGMHGGSWGHETWNRYAEVEINPDLQFRIIHYIHSETGEKRPSDNYIFHFGKFAYTETEQFLEIIGNVFENADLVKL